jgi:hypothetical protein
LLPVTANASEAEIVAYPTSAHGAGELTVPQFPASIWVGTVIGRDPVSVTLSPVPSPSKTLPSNSMTSRVRGVAFDS